MNNHEAQFVLNAYRPNGQDAADPQFSDALAQARRDPALQRWFDDSIAFDKAITEKLCAVEVPAGLRENILAGGKVSRPSGWLRPLHKLAIAAAILLFAIAGFASALLVSALSRCTMSLGVRAGATRPHHTLAS